MAFSQFLWVFCATQLLTASTQAVKKGSTLDTYRRLFKPGYLVKLEEGDTAEAKKELAGELEVSFIPANYDNTKNSIKRLLDEEKLTEEVFRERRYESVDQAKAAYKSRAEVEKVRREKYYSLLNEMNKYGALQASPFRPLYNALNQYFPRLGEQVDPLSGAPSMSDLSRKLGELTYEMEKRQKFIEENPRWFLKKGYYTKDQFGMERAFKTMAKDSETGQALKGDGQTILVLDSFSTAMPDRLKEKCVNYDEFKDVEAAGNNSDHGIKVASVAVDSKIGVAPNAKFRASKHLGYLPSLFELDRSNLDPTCMNNMIRITEPKVGTHHLHQIEEFLKNDPPRFSIFVDVEGIRAFRCIDASSIKIPEESVINLSFSYIDHVDGNRDIKESVQKLPDLIEFATMVLVFARAGKIMVCSAGNLSVSIGYSQAYAFYRALSQYKPECFISALALDEDNVSMSYFTNQPGNHPIQFCSLSAPGTNVPVVKEDDKEELADGTSFAAPYIVGAMALIMSNYPEASAQEVRHALIYMAAPVVMKWSESRNGYFPLMIRGARNGNLISGQTYKYFGKDLKVKQVFVTGEMIRRGREKYGAGIINISGAATYLHLNRTEPEALKRIMNQHREAEWQPHLV